MKVYHIYDENGKWMTVTQNKKAVMHKCLGKRSQSAAGGGGQIWSFAEQDVPEDWAPQPMEKPVEGCKTFDRDLEGRAKEVELDE